MCGESKLNQAKKSWKFRVNVGGENHQNDKKIVNSAFFTKKHVNVGGENRLWEGSFIIGAREMNNWWHSSKNRLLQNGSLIHVTVLYFINGRLGTYEILCPSRYLLEQSNIRRSLLRAALSPCIQQSPSRTRRSPKGGGALTNGRHRRHLADARHGHAVVDFFRKN